MSGTCLILTLTLISLPGATGSRLAGMTKAASPTVVEGAFEAVSPKALTREQDPVDLIQQGRELITAGVNRNQTDLIMQGRAVFERLLAAEELEPVTRYYLGLAEYRLANLGWAEGRRSVRQHINAAIGHLERAIELEPDSAEALALLGGAYGIKIAVNALTAMTLGSKNQQVRERARELDPDNPRVVLLDAVSYFNTPGAFGGDKEKALELALQAAELFAAEEVSDPELPRWGKEEVWAWIGMIRADADDNAAARQAYEKALEINPDYGWVKNVLLPDLPPGS